MIAVYVLFMNKSKDLMINTTTSIAVVIKYNTAEYRSVLLVTFFFLKF